MIIKNIERNKLNNWNLKNGRIDVDDNDKNEDLEKITNQEKLEKLFRKYNIWKISTKSLEIIISKVMNLPGWETAFASCPNRLLRGPTRRRRVRGSTRAIRRFVSGVRTSDRTPRSRSRTSRSERCSRFWGQKKCVR